MFWFVSVVCLSDAVVLLSVHYAVHVPPARSLWTLFFLVECSME